MKIEILKPVWDWIKGNVVPLSALASLLTIATIIYGFSKSGKELILKFWNRITRYPPKLPRETIKIHPQINGCWWHMGSSNSKLAMQVVGDWEVTNIIKGEVHIVGACLCRPRTDGRVLIQHPNENIFGKYPILPGATVQITANFWIQPPICKASRDFKATVILFDQFRNEYKIKDVVFEYR